MAVAHIAAEAAERSGMIADIEYCNLAGIECYSCFVWNIGCYYCMPVAAVAFFVLHIV